MDNLMKVPTEKLSDLYTKEESIQNKVSTCDSPSKKSN